MHDPIGLLPLWSSPSIEHKGLLHPHKVPFPFVNLLIFSCGLPVPRFCCSIGPHPSWVLPILLAEEVPLFLPYLGFLCTTHINSTKSIFHSNLKNNHQITNQQLKLIIRRYKVDPVIEKRWKKEKKWWIQIFLADIFNKTNKLIFVDKKKEAKVSTVMRGKLN